MNIKNRVDKLGSDLIEIFHVIGLFVIGSTIIWAAIWEYINIMQSGNAAGLKDILLLFIYLELGAMTGIYFKTHKMPVVFLIFIAITAIIRFLVIDMKEIMVNSETQLIALVSSILVLTLAALIMRYTDKKFPEDEY